MPSSPVSRRGFLRGATAIAALATLGARGGPAHAAAGPLRILCTAPGGSIPDIVARRFAEQLSAHYAGGAVVDNRTGAAGQIAVAALKQASPDGATMLLAQGAVATVYPYLYERLAYDPVADLVPVSLAAEATLALAVGPAVPATVASVPDYVAWARAHPRLANYGSPGTGTLPHLLSALLAHETRVDWQHVGYGGGPPAIADLLAGRIASLALPEGLLRPHHEAGRVRVLATSGPTRSAFMPAIPTFSEQGLPALVMREWFALFMPRATAQPVVETAASRAREAAGRPAVQRPLAEIGMLAAASTPQELAQRIAGEQRYWQRVLHATGVRAE